MNGLTEQFIDCHVCDTAQIFETRIVQLPDAYFHVQTYFRDMVQKASNRYNLML